MRKTLYFVLALVVCASLTGFHTARAQGDSDSRVRACVAALSQGLARQLTLKDYPEALQNSGTQGTVLVQLSLDRTGRFRASTLAKTSGNAMLDQAALRAVERVFLRSSVAPRECDLGTEFLVTLPLRFGLRDVPRER